MNKEKILVELDSNEAGSSRAKSLALAVNEDPRFELVGFAELDVDVCFSLDVEKTTCIEDSIGCQAFVKSTVTKSLQIEIKDFTGKKEDNSDYLNSILSGHLKDQVLAMRENQIPARVLVLGDDPDVLAAIQKVVTPRYRGEEARRMISTYWNLIIDFEANSEALNIPVWYIRSSPWKRVLSRVDKLLSGPDRLLTRPAPAENDRQIAALAMLLGSGVGPAKAKAILEKFNLKLEAKEDSNDEQLLSCPGIGPTLAARIREKIEVEE